MTIMSYATVICQDVDRVADFYGSLLQLEEIRGSRSPNYREFLTGGSKLGFTFSGAYAALNLPERAPQAPVNTMLSFDVGQVQRVDALTQLAVEVGARLTKAPGPTSFGQYQSALTDPEGNVFRITATAPSA